MNYTVKAPVTLHVGVWSATVHARAEVTVTPNSDATDSRDFSLSHITHESLTPFAEGSALHEEFRKEIHDALLTRAKQYLSGNLALHDVLELAEVTRPTGDWRICPHQLGWVNGLEHAYHGVLLATNGMLGITRCNDLQFRCHQMSHWSKRRSRHVRPTKDAVEPEPKVSRATIEAAAMELLGL